MIRRVACFLVAVATSFALSPAEAAVAAAPTACIELPGWQHC